MESGTLKRFCYCECCGATSILKGAAKCAWCVCVLSNLTPKGNYHFLMFVGQLCVYIRIKITISEHGKM